VISLVRIVPAALALLLALGCSKKEAARESNPEGKAATKVKLALNWVPEPEFGGFYDARERGFYRKHGLEVEVMGGGAGVPVVQMVATGRVDFGTAGGDEIVMARARGADVVAVFATFQTSPQGIMVHAAKKLAALPDVFKSGTLAIEPGLPYAAFLKKKFPWEGLKVVPYDGGVARFLSDPTFAQQCYVTSEPIAAKKQGGDVQVFLVADAGFNPYGTVVITRRDLIKQQPELVRAFVDATREGWRDYLADPLPVNELLGRLNGAMDPATLAASADAQKPLIETEDTKTGGLGAMTRARWERLASQLKELGIIDKPVPADELFSAPETTSAVAR
jgi:NitT/TauT family transport system substrate-binding protein